MTPAGPSPDAPRVLLVFCSRCGARNDDPAAVECRSCGVALDAGLLLDRTAAIPAIHGDGGRDVEVRVSERETVAQLVVTRGPNLGSRYQVSGQITIGRSPSSTVLLDDVSVSRSHAVVSATAEALVIEDAGSLNGTYVNGRRIEVPTALDHGDHLQIGRYKLTVITP